MLSVDKSLQVFLNSFSRRRRSSSHGSGLLKKPNLAYLHQRRRSLPGRVSLHKFLHRDKQSKCKKEWEELNFNHNIAK